MRVLFVWTAAEFSIMDVARGYRDAFVRAGHDVVDFRLYERFKFIEASMRNSNVRETLHAARPDDPNLFEMEVSKIATETVIIEAMKMKPDLVFIVSALGFHPNGLWLLKTWNEQLQASEPGFKCAVLFTESPYEDKGQANFASIYPAMTVFCNDKFSAAKHGWHYLRHAHDPLIHRPVAPDEEKACDVLMIGTGWPERQAFFEAIDWTGINLRIAGLWPGLHGDDCESPLKPYYVFGCIDNEHTPALYCGAKVNLNMHRRSDVAYSVGPRVIELAACGAYQLTDYRLELDDLFPSVGGELWIDTFETSFELSERIRFALANPEWRRIMAEKQRAAVVSETFDHRLVEIFRVLGCEAETRVAPLLAAK